MRVVFSLIAAMAMTTLASAAPPGGGTPKPVIATDVQCTGCVNPSDIAPDAVGNQQIQSGAVGSSEIATDAVGSQQIQPDAVGSSEIAAGSVDEPELSQTIRDRITALEEASFKPRLVLVDGNNQLIGEVVDLRDSNLREWLVFAELQGRQFLLLAQSYVFPEVTLATSANYWTDGNCRPSAATVVAPSPTDAGPAFLDPALYGFANQTFAVLADVSQGIQQVVVDSSYTRGNQGSNCASGYSSTFSSGYRALVIRHNWQPPYRIAAR